MSNRRTGLATMSLIASVAIPTCLLAGCSNSGSSAASGDTTAAAASTGATAAAGVSVPAGAGAAISAATGPGGPLDVSKLCAAIKPADVQALMKAAVTAVVDYPGECSFYGGDLKVDIYLNDPTQKYYQNAVGAPGTTPLPGVGDQAQWSQPVPAMTTPYIEAHKGSTTCITETADPPETTMPYTGSDPFFTITTADAAAYAAKEGALCNDVFGAA
jgi:hypothetical protein